jgi:hypothetical protein
MGSSPTDDRDDRFSHPVQHVLFDLAKRPRKHGFICGEELSWANEAEPLQATGDEVTS